MPCCILLRENTEHFRAFPKIDGGSMQHAMQHALAKRGGPKAARGFVVERGPLYGQE